MYFYDLESTFLRKGFKRTDQRLLEVGIVQGRKTYSSLVDPVKGYPIISRLEELGQHPERTIRFWTKLLAGKGLLNTAVRRKPFEEQAKYIDKIRKNFLSPEEAVKGMLAFGTGTWVAHNGKSFDQKIMQGYFDRLGLKPDITFKDSLPEIRKMKLQSHSLGYVYRHLFGGTFRQHHAEDDAVALQRICKHLKLFQSTPLTSLKGVGPKSDRVFKGAGIASVEELKAWIQDHKRTDWKFKVHHSCALANRMFQRFKM